MYLTPKKQKALLGEQTELITTYKNHWDKTYKGSFNDYRMMADGEMPKKVAAELKKTRYKRASKLIPRVIPDGIDYLRTIIVDALFNRAEVFGLAGRGSEDHVRAEFANALVHYEFDITDVEDQFDKIIEDACTLGGGFGEINHWEDRRLNPGYTGKDGEFSRNDYKTIYAGPRLVYQKAESIFLTPGIKDFDKISAYARLFATNISNIQMLTDKGSQYHEYAKNVPKIKASHFDIDGDQENDTQTDHERDSQDVHTKDFQVQLAVVWEKRPPVDGSVPQWHRTIIANYKHNPILLEFEKDPMKTGKHPLVMCRIYPKNNRVYGEGVPEKVYNYMLEKFHKRNQRIDFVNLAHILGGTIFAPQGLLDKKALLLDELGKIINVNAGNVKNDISTIALDLAPLQSSLQEELLVDNDIEKTLATNKVSMGQGTGQRESATEVYTVDQNAKVRANSPIRAVEKTLLKPTVKGYLIHSQLFMPEEFAIRVTGRDMGKIAFKDLKRSDILGQFDVKCNASRELLTRAMKQALMDRVIQTYSGNPRVQLNWQRLAREHFELLEIPDVDVIVPDMGDEAQRIDRENGMLMNGNPIEALLFEPHEEHMIKHMEAKQTAQILAGSGQILPEIITVIDAHIQDHERKRAILNGETGQGDQVSSPTNPGQVMERTGGSTTPSEF